MGLPEPDMQVYYDELTLFLKQIREEIEEHSRHLNTDHLDQDSLESCLLDLNTYYYRGFHERYFPLYKTQIEADIRSLYRISREEAALKEDIINNLKRMAEIYNRVKYAIKLLEISRDSVSELLQSSERGQEQRIVELLYTLKDLDNNLLTFLNLLNKWQSFLTDQDLLKSLAEYPFHLALHRLLLNWEADNSRFIRDFKRFMINLQLAAQLLVKLQYSDDPCQTARRTVLEELEKLEVNLASKKSTPFLATWYKQHIQNQFLMYIDLLGLYAEKNERKRFLQTAQAFEKWLQALLYLLEKASLSPEEFRPLFLDLQSLALLPLELDEINKQSRETSAALQDLIKDLTAATKPGFVHFSTAAKQIISEAYGQFKHIVEQGKIPPGTVLANGLSRLSMQISLLEMHLDLLSDKEEHRGKLRQQYQLMLHNMDAYQALLQEAKNELARALAPRNISRNFKEMEIRLEHIPVNQDEIFPALYLHLLPESTGIDTETAELDYIVQEEAGDIFIFKLDELYEVIVPHIVLTRKG